MPKNRKTIGLALSGGGARGLAHIGILKVLDRYGIRLDYISGSSMGGVIAAAYASGMSAVQLEEIAFELTNLGEIIRLVTLMDVGRGLLDEQRVAEFLCRLFSENSTFEDTIIPLALPAVDLITAREITLRSGALLPAVQATIAVPGLLEPVLIGPYRLVDGGILNNLPVNLLREMGAQVLIGVDVQSDPLHEPPWQDLPEHPRWPVSLPDSFLNFYRAELIMIAELTHYRLKEVRPDLLIHPPIAPDITMIMGFTRIKDIIDAGELAGMDHIQQILEYVQ